METSTQDNFGLTQSTRNDMFTVQDVIYSYATAMDLSMGEVEERIVCHATQTQQPLNTAREWLDVADDLFVQL